MNATLKILVGILLIALALPAIAGDFDTRLPLVATPGGSYAVTGSFDDGTKNQFIVDTGAGLSSLSRELYKQLSAKGRVTEVRRVATRMANGKYEAAAVYQVEGLILGGRCELEAVEFVVVNRSLEMRVSGNAGGLLSRVSAFPYTLQCFHASDSRLHTNSHPLG